MRGATSWRWSPGPLVTFPTRRAVPRGARSTFVAGGRAGSKTVSHVDLRSTISTLLGEALAELAATKYTP